MEVRTEQREGVLVIQICGALDLVNLHLIQPHFREALEGESQRVVVDFTESPYTDSAGFGALLAFHGKLQKYGGRLLLANAPPSMRMAMKLSRLDRVLASADSVDEALAKLREDEAG